MQHRNVYSLYFVCVLILLSLPDLYPPLLHSTHPANLSLQPLPLSDVSVLAITCNSFSYCSLSSEKSGSVAFRFFTPLPHFLSKSVRSVKWNRWCQKPPMWGGWFLGLMTALHKQSTSFHLQLDSDLCVKRHVLEYAWRAFFSVELWDYTRTAVSIICFCLAFTCLEKRSETANTLLAKPLPRYCTLERYWQAAEEALAILLQERALWLCFRHSQMYTAKEVRGWQFNNQSPSTLL